MTIRPIRLLGDPVLNSVASPVALDRFDDKLRRLVDDMLDTMDDAGGVGLAANQVGVLQRVFVYDTSMVEGGLRGHVINPTWVAVGDQRQLGNEGCLSVPDLSFDVERHQTVLMQGRDVANRPVSMLASGLLARCIQHEADHLDGVMYLSKLDVEQYKQAMSEVRASDWFNS
ncbi:peptide deformylase [Corynebacterium guangdongense]|uniref:Peptide deformylase n=1 Tax=Corynebacterium guangdongense TaxID=1783348 RepID=A0ABU1ZWU0_9CORY|nr:peptide deformylase [Corynebacterium guangdongense]MDR7329409.1 peptide deformylase [Corynebacterium guangdongense]WJZ17974.1 Peptide deformylase [Corynebacterium guangdongense]